MPRIIDLQQRLLVGFLLADRVYYQPAAAFQVMQSFDNRLPSRGWIDNTIEFFRRRRLRVPGPVCAELPGKVSFGFASGKNEDPGVGEIMQGHFQYEMGRRPKAGQSQAPAILNPGQVQGSISDGAGAQ